MPSRAQQQAVSIQVPLVYLGRAPQLHVNHTQHVLTWGRLFAIRGRFSLPLHKTVQSSQSCQKRREAGNTLKLLQVDTALLHIDRLAQTPRPAYYCPCRCRWILWKTLSSTPIGVSGDHDVPAINLSRKLSFTLRASFFPSGLSSLSKWVFCLYCKRTKSGGKRNGLWFEREELVITHDRQGGIIIVHRGC